MAVGLSPPVDLHSVDGVELAAFAADIRYQDRDDIVLLTMSEGSSVAGVFTKNKYCAAPVVLAKEHIHKGASRALLINAGNANAGTGKQGMLDAQQSCEAVAQAMRFSAFEVLPFSTGVIGEKMPMEKVLGSIPTLVDQLGADNWLSAAQAIMTTDTVAKAASEQLQIDGQTITLTGMAKGSGMICPNMATMLAFVATDAKIDATVLQTMLQRATDQSFNRITVDSDTSTNDAFMLVATGKAEQQKISNLESAQAAAFYAALERLSIKLATSVVRDGEGATKFVKVTVEGAKTVDDAKSIAYSVAHSPLVKTALYASDPNWGRLLAAIGKADVSALDLDSVQLKINDLDLITQGQPSSSYTESLGKAEFEKQEIELEINLGLGVGTFHLWTTDLSHDYVTINADYRS